MEDIAEEKAHRKVSLKHLSSASKRLTLTRVERRRPGERAVPTEAMQKQEQDREEEEEEKHPPLSKKGSVERLSSGTMRTRIPSRGPFIQRQSLGPHGGTLHLFAESATRTEPVESTPEGGRMATLDLHSISLQHEASRMPHTISTFEDSEQRRRGVIAGPPPPNSVSQTIS